VQNTTPRAVSTGLTLGTAAALVTLLAAAATPAEAAAELRAAAAAPDVTGPLVALVALVAWTVAGWLTITALLALLARAQGLAGRLGTAAARRVAPTGVRRAVELALGLTVTVGVLGAAPASAIGAPAEQRAAATTSAPAAAPPSLDWAGSEAGPDLDWPAPGPPPAASTQVRAAPVPTGQPGAAADPVVVQPGDSLWRLAAQDLARRTGAEPSVAQTAAAWPSWWAANRETVGADPHLLHPGTGLRPPPDLPA
jgi:resuscitation-promoting factor RpfA